MRTYKPKKLKGTIKASVGGKNKRENKSSKRFDYNMDFWFTGKYKALEPESEPKKVRLETVIIDPEKISFHLKPLK
jgi:hypothetical protein